MKNFKNLLHILLTIASVFGFLGGWATLAHSRKPLQTVSNTQVVEPLPALSPLPAMNLNPATDNSSNGGLTIIAPSAGRLSRSIFATSGS
jgi:hypothetical protein